MTVKAQHEDPATGQLAAVYPGGLAATAWWLVPAGSLTPAQVTQQKAFSARFATSAGSESAAVDGSATPVELYVGAVNGRIRFVSELRLVIEGTNFKLDSNEIRRFGPVVAPGLANGIELQAEQGGVVTDLFTDPITIAGDLLEYASPEARGVVNVVDGVSAGVDVVIATIRLARPVGLPAGSTDRLVLRIRDDLSGLSRMDLTAIGWQEVL